VGAEHHQGRTFARGQGPRQSTVALSASARFTGSGGRFRLVCRAEGSSLRASHARIAAMRVGRLDRVQLPSGEVTSFGADDATPYVKHVIQGGKTTLAPMDADDPTPPVVMSFTLGRGTWWVRTTLTAGTDSHPSTPVGRCVQRGDTSGPTNVGAIVAGRSKMLTLDTAFRVTGLPATVTLRCGRQSDAGPVWVSGIRTTAVRLGRLDVGTGSVPWDPDTFGSGTPRALHATRATVALEPDSASTTVAVLPVPAGEWLLTGKVVLSDGASEGTRCWLTAAPLTTPLDDTADNLTVLGGGATIAFQASASRDAPFEARVRCSKEEHSYSPGPLTVMDARLTAIRVDRVVVAP
jgi:hypothetical protein